MSLNVSGVLVTLMFVIGKVMSVAAFVAWSWWWLLLPVVPDVVIIAQKVFGA